MTAKRLPGHSVARLDARQRYLRCRTIAATQSDSGVTGREPPAQHAFCVMADAHWDLRES
ncbi:hypothetical protein FKG94_01555 [Exilibacterium tricleocarpae]|uniref:Uncharacterized protein n=1 Tax=Exilibacterium tricleocarpae TaxID=2591008 RepID=A0A545UA27_9GAMM|nr:hypothetical protein [Exilibacterium tricleocarpae]TQV86263.1 hypothetical protein FKG94_01555 [Exilibacterium tricleocarpae]